LTTEQQIKDWYDKKYAKHGVRSMRPYAAYPIFLDYLGAQKGEMLLDVSCGTGYLLLAASQRGLKTFGIDISSEAVRVAQTVSPNSAISVGKGEDLEFDDDTFDYVTCLGALEHFLDINKGLREMRRVAKDGATFCIMVPNSDYIFWKITGKSGTAQQEIHENLLSLQQWKRIFADGGFEITHIYPDRWLMKSVKVFSTLNPLVILKRLVYKIGWIFLPLNYTYQFVFILRKSG
jgi:ubiquinone/menaquinone biosynthesis C-methylase UbiE